MAEEQKWQQPPATTNHLLCANNCGFFGSPTTLNLCSKCYQQHHPQFPPQSQSPSSSSTISVPVIPVSSIPLSASPIPNNPTAEESDLPLPVLIPEVKLEQRNRCGSCRKRVGLTGFTCRCGRMFCGVHRYPEKHECSFDFKTEGKEAIAKANPVVKAAKLDRI